MKQKVSAKIIALTFGILTILFLTSFYIFAWQEPKKPPPEGNVPAPINVGPTHQKKVGDLTIGQADIKGDGSISTNLNSDLLDYYHAADLLAKVTASGLYGHCGESRAACGVWGNYPVCHGARGPAYCISKTYICDCGIDIYEPCPVQGSECRCPADYELVLTGAIGVGYNKYFTCYKK